MNDGPLGFDFSGITLRVAGLDEGFRTRLNRRWSAFVTEPPAAPFLRVNVVTEGSQRDLKQPFAPKAMGADLRAERAVYSMPEGVAEVGIDGDAEVRIGCDRGDRYFYAVLNLLRACLAFSMPNRQGAMLHAAGLVLDGRGFLLVGSEGSGKSSWARLGEQQGGHVVSDDVVLTDGGGRVLQALGAPLYSTHAVSARPGRWPVAAILFPEKAERAEIVPVGSMIARARLAANLPFVADALGSDPRVDGTLERLVSAVPCADLRFPLSGSFVDLLRLWPAREE